MKDKKRDEVEEQTPSRLARVWTFTKRHAVPIGAAAGGIAVATIGIAMPSSMREGIANGARKMLTGSGAKKTAAATAVTLAAAATTPAEKPIERTLMGLSESQLNEIAQGVYHGVSAAFDKFGHLIFRYKSNSGRSVMSARISAGPDGIGIDQGLVNVCNASSIPRVFMRRVIEEAEKTGA